MLERAEDGPGRPEQVAARGVEIRRADDERAVGRERPRPAPAARRAGRTGTSMTSNIAAASNDPGTIAASSTGCRRMSSPSWLAANPNACPTARYRAAATRHAPPPSGRTQRRSRPRSAAAPEPGPPAAAHGAVAHVEPREVELGSGDAERREVPRSNSGCTSEDLLARRPWVGVDQPACDASRDDVARLVVQPARLRPAAQRAGDRVPSVSKRVPVASGQCPAQERARSAISHASAPAARAAATGRGRGTGRRTQRQQRQQNCGDNVEGRPSATIDSRPGPRPRRSRSAPGSRTTRFASRLPPGR